MQWCFVFQEYLYEALGLSYVKNIVPGSSDIDEAADTVKTDNDALVSINLNE